MNGSVPGSLISPEGEEARTKQARLHGLWDLQRVRYTPARKAPRAICNIDSSYPPEWRRRAHAVYGEKIRARLDDGLAEL